MDTKQKKRAIIIGVILGILLVTGITGAMLIKFSQPVYTKLSIALMPETLEYTDSDGKKMTFYIEENKKFDAKKDDPIDAYKTYYLDEKDNKVYLKDGIYMTDKEYAESKRIKSDSGKNNDSEVRENIGQGQMVTVGFLYSAQEKANKVLAGFRWVTAIFAVCCAAYLIYLWYLDWSRREDKKKAMLEEAEAVNAEKFTDKKDEE
ncbi:MAG: hypothetical protein IJI47_04895 [Eubacterium sp.]|nr:hypothetical protein [Eubacterium sp.]